MTILGQYLFDMLRIIVRHVLVSSYTLFTICTHHFFWVHGNMRQQYDAAVGDITIRPNRSLFVDFTMAFTETGVAMIVPLEKTRIKSMWIFLLPLEVNLWLVIGAFFVFTGWVVWTIEHNDNSEFKGPLAQQIGTAIWNSFLTLLFPQCTRTLSICFSHSCPSL